MTVYNNLRAEMARHHLTIQSMAAGLKMNRDTLSRKLSGKSPLYLDEAFKIQRMFFPDLDVSYLFRQDVNDDVRKGA